MNALITSIPLSSPHVHSQFCDGRNTAEEMVLAAISRGFVSLGISGHFDLVMRNNRHHELFDPSDPAVTRAAFECMEQAITGCRLLEVNTGAIPRFGASSPYPELPLLRHWHHLGGEVILSSDCHFADQIDGGYEQGIRRMKDAGYKQMKLLGRGKELFETAEI